MKSRNMFTHLISIIILLSCGFCDQLKYTFDEYLGLENSTFEIDCTGSHYTSIDGNILKRFTKCKKLTIKNTSISEIPYEITFLENLKSLIFSNNRCEIELSSLAVVSKLPNLTTLNLEGNQIMNIPDFFQTFQNIKNLNISNNSLNCIPFSICMMKNLKILEANANKINRLPAQILFLENLQLLNLCNNSLLNLSSEIGFLRKLKFLFLRKNDLETLPEEIGNLKDLFSLDISENDISSLPLSFLKLTNLKKLKISDNCLLEISTKDTLGLDKLKNMNFETLHSENMSLSFNSLKTCFNKFKQSHYHWNLETLRNSNIKDEILYLIKNFSDKDMRSAWNKKLKYQITDSAVDYDTDSSSSDQDIPIVKPHIKSRKIGCFSMKRKPKKSSDINNNKNTLKENVRKVKSTENYKKLQNTSSEITDESENALLNCTSQSSDAINGNLIIISAKKKSTDRIDQENYNVDSFNAFENDLKLEGVSRVDTQYIENINDAKEVGSAKSSVRDLFRKWKKDLFNKNSNENLISSENSHKSSLQCVSSQRKPSDAQIFEPACLSSSVQNNLNCVSSKDTCLTNEMNRNESVKSSLNERNSHRQLTKDNESSVEECAREPSIKSNIIEEFLINEQERKPSLVSNKVSIWPLFIEKEAPENKDSSSVEQESKSELIIDESELKVLNEYEESKFEKISLKDVQSQRSIVDRNGSIKSEKSIAKNDEVQDENAVIFTSYVNPAFEEELSNENSEDITKICIPNIYRDTMELFEQNNIFNETSNSEETCPYASKIKASKLSLDNSFDELQNAHTSFNSIDAFVNRSISIRKKISIFLRNISDDQSVKNSSKDIVKAIFVKFLKMSFHNTDDEKNRKLMSDFVEICLSDSIIRKSEEFVSFYISLSSSLINYECLGVSQFLRQKIALIKERCFVEAVQTNSSRGIAYQNMVRDYFKNIIGLDGGKEYSNSLQRTSPMRQKQILKSFLDAFSINNVVDELLISINQSNEKVRESYAILNSICFNRLLLTNSSRKSKINKKATQAIIQSEIESYFDSKSSCLSDLKLNKKGLFEILLNMKYISIPKDNF